MTDPVLLTPRITSDLNRSRVLQALCDHGPTSRADLARLAGVPRATIGAIVQGLLDDALLEEQEPVHETGQVGKPARPLWFRERSALSVAVAFEPRAVRAALVNARGELLEQESCPLETRAASSEELVRTVRAAVSGLVPPEPLLGVGVAVPGVVSRSGFVLGARQLPGAEGTVMTDGLAGLVDVPIVVDSDPHARALGEKWFGDGRNLANFASVQTGGGVGVGLVVGGGIFRGEDGLGGWLGHTCVDPAGLPCRCGLRGCWETVATLSWLRRAAAERGLPGAASMDSATLVGLTADPHAGDGASELLQAYAENLSLGLSTLVQLLGLRTILLHGDVIGGGEAVREMIERATRKRCLPQLRDDVHVRLSGRAADAGLLGAAGLVLSRTFALAV